MFKSRFQIAGEALAIAALSASALAQNPQAPINTLTDLEAALQACWAPPPMEQSRPGMQITVLMSFKRNGELFEQSRIVFQSREASETERSSYRIAVAQTLKRCASLPFTEALGNTVAGQPLTMTFVDDREQPPDLSRQYEPSVAVTTERGARRRHGCRTYGLDEGRHGNQRDDRENSNKLLHDTSPRWCASKQRPYELNVSVN